MASKAIRRIVKLLAGLFVVSLALVLVAIGILLYGDVALLRKPLQDMTSAALGREVRIGGAMSLERSREPRLVVEDVSIANPAWASRPQLATIKRLDIRIELQPLFDGDLRIIRLAIDGADVLLERGPQQQANWVFDGATDQPVEEDRGPGVAPRLDSLEIENSVLAYRQASGEVASLALERLQASRTLTEASRIEARGTYRDEPFELDFSGAPILNSLEQNVPWPVMLKLRSAYLTASVNGTVAQPASFKGVALDIAIEGQRLEKLEPLVQTPLPVIGSYRLTASLADLDAGYSLSELALQLGKSDLRGEISLLTGGPKPRIAARLASTSVHLEALRAALAQMPKQQAPPANAATPPGVALLRKIDAELELDVQEIVDTAIPLTRLSLTARLADGRLTLKPLDARIAKHALAADLILDATEAQPQLELSAQLGDNQLSAKLSWAAVAERPTFNGRITAKQLNVAQLDRIVAAFAQPREPRPKGRLPSLGFLREFDAELALDIQRMTNLGYPLTRLSLTASLDNAQLSLANISTDLFGKQVTGKAQLGLNDQVPVIAVDVVGKHIPVKQTLEGRTFLRPFDGALDEIRLKLNTQGQTYRDLLANADAEVDAQAASLRYLDPLSSKWIPIELTAKTRILRRRAIRTKITGRYRGLPVKAQLEMGSLAALLWGRKPLPVDLEIQAVQSALSAKGTVEKPLQARGFDLMIGLEGARLDSLNPILETSLPSIGPYAINTHLVEHRSGYSLRDTKARLGRSSASGELDFRTDGPRLRVSANLVSDEINVEDFNPPNGDANVGVAESPYIIPSLTIPAELLTKVDADVALDIRHLLIGTTELGDVELKAQLQRGYLTVSPLAGSLSGAEFSSDLLIDARHEPPSVVLRTRLKHFDYGALLRNLGVSKRIKGVLDFELALAGKGVTREELLASANGHIRVIGGEGEIPNRLLQLWSGDLFMLVLRPVVGREELTGLNCIVSAYEVRDGVAQADSILVDFSKITVGGVAAVELATEVVEGVLQPAPKDPSLVTLKTPVHITGTLKHVNAEVAKSTKYTLLGKTAVVAIVPWSVLALFGDVGAGHENRCQEAIERLDEAVPPDSKTRKSWREQARDVLDIIQDPLEYAPGAEKLDE